MFPTGTKAAARVVGPGVLGAYVPWGRLPHLAIGGITPENVGELLAVGVRGVAVSTAVCMAPDPGAVVAQLQGLLAPEAVVRAV
jgi:thiamine monophosphate synthase